MSTDALLVTVAVVTVLVSFAAVLAWADRQSDGLNDAPAPKRRGF